MIETDCWPTNDFYLSQLYHPVMNPEHKDFHRLPADQQALVQALQKQYDRWSHKLYFKRGLPGRLIAALNGYHFAAKLCSCMMVANKYTKHVQYGRCHQDWFCEFCAYMKGQDLLKKYAGAWADGSWFEMVLSLEVGVCPSEPEDDWIADVYDAMEAAVKRLQAEKNMQGYLGWLEVKVHQFYPNLLCTPHIHVLLHCDCPPDHSSLAAVIAGEWASRKLRSVPDLLLKPVKSEAHFYELLRYIKPIDLLGPYDQGYRAARAAGRIECFHQEVQDFFLAMRYETSDCQQKWNTRLRASRDYIVTRRRFFYGGNCHGSAKYPLGLNLAERRTKEHQNAVRDQVAAARDAEDRNREAD